MIRRRLHAALFALALALPGGAPAGAADISVQPLSDTLDAILVEGELKLDDDRRFIAAMLQTEDAVVLLDSPGGSLAAGLGIGKAIRLYDVATVVPEGATCASACALAWLGGHRRFMGDGARIGFHAAYTVDEAGDAQETGSGNALVGAYVSQLGLSEQAIVYITMSAPEEMQWLTLADAQDLGITVAALASETRPASAPAAPILAPKTGSGGSTTTALPKPTYKAPALKPAAVTWRVRRNVSEGYQNIRSGPGTMHGVVFTIPAGAGGIVLDDCGPPDPGGGRYDWCAVSWQGRQGWASQNGFEQE